MKNRIDAIKSFDCRSCNWCVSNTINKMSGHNPHSRSVGHAVNSSQWNHLQVPSFIPRQPQLAHMSNERPIRSPLAWHHSATNSAEALYGYMAAAAAAAASNNHKTVCSKLFLFHSFWKYESFGFLFCRIR